MRRRISMSVPLLPGITTFATAQPTMPADPTPPPPLIQRFREAVKVGKDDAHEANERAWARAADADFWKGSAVMQAGAPTEKKAPKTP